MAGTYPLGTKGTIIGTPYAGTHTLGNWQSDNAVDIKVPVGTPVYAVADGVVGSRIGAFDTTNPRFAGLRATVQSNDNAFYYAHMSKLAVKAGEHVKAGQLIGYSGEANGVAHLHFAVKNGTPGDTIRGAAVPATTTAPTPQQQPASPDITSLAVTPPATVAPPTAVAPTGPAPAAPGSQDFTLDESQVYATWQQIGRLQDLSPETQRYVQLAGGTGGA